MIDFKKYIHIDPNIRFGKPTIIGTRISVYDVLSWLSEGMTNQEIIYDFSELSQEQIKACLSYAANRINKVSVA